MDESNECGFAALTLCALSGLGGVGKTTLATEFAYKYQQFYDFVYWMDGGTKRDFIFSCESLLKRFGVSTSKQQEDNEHVYFLKVIHLLNRALSTSGQQWLLIVDNIEEPEFVADFAPSRGHILYTSRNRDWPKKLEIDVFKPEESVAYLLQMTQKMTCFDKSPEAAMALAIELEHLPLALAQAVAYINMQRLPSFMEYLVHYQASQAELLAKKQIQSSLNGKYGREAIVMTTWNTTMQHMSAETQQFMRYISYVNPSNIQLKLFDELDSLEDTTTQLNEYSMIKIDESKIGLGKIASLHHLVQLVERLNHKKERKTGHLIDSLLLNWICFWNKKGEENGLIPGRVAGKYSSNLTALNALAIFSNSHVLCIRNHIEKLIEKGEGYDRLIENWKTLDSLINVRKKMFAAIICMLKVSGCKLPEFLNKGTLLSLSTMKETSDYLDQKYPKGIKHKSYEGKPKFQWAAPNGVIKTFRELHVDGSQGNCGFIAIGIDRKEAIQLLIANAEDELTQQFIAPEIRALITTPEEDSLLPPILQSLRTYFYHERNALVEQLEVKRSVLNESLGLVGEEALTFEEMHEYLNLCQDHYTLVQLFNENFVRLQQINRDMEAFSPTAEQLKAFVKYEFELKNGYLSYFRGGGGALEAIARLRNIEVTILEGDVDLTQTLYVPSGDDSNHIYFLHHVGGVDASGRIFLNHFNLLEDVT
jgi:hypothetical protein